MDLSETPADLPTQLSRFRVPVDSRWVNYWRTRASAYILGQILPGARKSMQPMASRLDDVSYDQIQRFITDSPWDWEATQEDLIRVVSEDVGTAEGLLSLDDTAFVKAGRHSVGVARQYCGQLGKIASCQVAVGLVYIRPQPPRSADAGVFPLQMRLYLPADWATDRVRRRNARVPARCDFQQKWRLGLGMVAKVRALGLPHEATVTDAGYGDCAEFREGLRTLGERYVVGVTSSALTVVRAGLRLREPRPRIGSAGRPPTRRRLPSGMRAYSAAILGVSLSPQEWQRVTWAQGTKQPLTGTFARARVRVVKRQFPTDEVAWLLFERRENETKAYLCHGYDESTLEDMVRVARGRWPVEQFFREAKEELGADYFEGRGWPGWHHHVTLTLLAAWYLSLRRWLGQDQETTEPLPTLPQIRRDVVREVALRILEQTPEEGDQGIDPRIRRRVLALVNNAG